MFCWWFSSVVFKKKKEKKTVTVYIEILRILKTPMMVYFKSSGDFFSLCLSRVSEWSSSNGDATLADFPLATRLSVVRSVTPAYARNDVRSHQSYDRVLRAHDYGHGHVFRLFLRDGLGFLQPETERSRRGVRDWRPNSGTRRWLLGFRPRSSGEVFRERLCAPAGTSVHRREAHTKYLYQLLGRHR